MVNNKEIRDRFMLCIKEIDESFVAIATAIESNPAYLSQLKTKDNPELTALLIAKFCLEYGYSPNFILLGEGAKKAKVQLTREEREIERLNNKLDQMIDIIGDMMNAMLELKPKWNSAQKELATRAKKVTQ